MSEVHLATLIHLGPALLARTLIGLERTFHGRPAAFRTHALVRLASSLLMLLTLYQEQWGGKLSHETVRLDPTRMAQGIMTGIGFLGAGVIFKEGLDLPAEGRGSLFEYQMVIRTTRRDDLARLAQSLHALPNLVEFEIAPASD